MGTAVRTSTHPLDGAPSRRPGCGRRSDGRCRGSRGAVRRGPCRARPVGGRRNPGRIDGIAAARRPASLTGRGPPRPTAPPRPIRSLLVLATPLVDVEEASLGDERHAAYRQRGHLTRPRVQRREIVGKEPWCGARRGRAGGTARRRCHHGAAREVTRHRVHRVVGGVGRVESPLACVRPCRVVDRLHQVQHREAMAPRVDERSAVGHPGWSA